MSVAITIQETVNEVDITVNQNVITVNVTRTTGSGGVESVNGETGVVTLTTDNVSEGSINLYFTVARVRSTILTGISFVSGSVITATDTVLSALGKLQKQISSIDLPYVLKIGDRVYQEAIPQSGTTYTFEIDDRWRDSTMQSGGAVTDIILDDDAFLFPNNSVIMFRVYDTTALFNYTALTDVRYLGATASANIPIEVGDDCRLKKTDGIWELVISNKSTGGSAQNSMTPSTTIAPTVSAVLTEYDMITGLTFSGTFALDKKGGRSYLPYTQTGSLTLSIAGSPIVGGFAVLRFTANGSAISGFSGWKLLSSDAITATNGVVHRVIVYQYEDEIWYSVKLN